MVSLQDIGFSFVYILDIHCGYNFYELSEEVEVDQWRINTEDDVAGDKEDGDCDMTKSVLGL